MNSSRNRKTQRPTAPRFRSSIAAACAGALALSSAALLAGMSAPARASVFTYSGSGSSHTVNAGILQLDSAKQVLQSGQFNPGGSSGALYSFYVLDQRTDYKPAGWRFVNPLAPTTITSDLANLYPTTYKVGQQITPNMAAYWMVNLPSVAAGYVPGQANPLAQYDMLVIRIDTNLSAAYIGLSRAERELLRDYVDQGGTLWVEDAVGAVTHIKDVDDGNNDTPAGLFVDVAFHDAGTAGQAYVSNASHRHPTLTAPNFLTYPEISSISYDTGNGQPVLPNYLSSQSGTGNPPDFDFLTTVIGNSADSSGGRNLPSIAAGDFGSGHVVIDDCNVLGGISEAVKTAVGDTTGYAPASLAAASPSDLQFAYNVLSWSGSESTTDGADARHSGAQTGADIGGSLLGSWTFPNVVNNANATVDGVGVAISGNVAYVASIDSQGSGGSKSPTLRAFDINPLEDLDQNNNPDDGDSVAAVDPLTSVPYLQDFSAGLNYDELWATRLGNNSTKLSAPTIASLPAGALGVNATGYYNAVLVEDQAGNIYIFDATSDPATASPTYLGFINTKSNSAFTGNVPSPVYAHGWLIAPQPSGGTGYPTVYLVYLGGGAASPPAYKERLDGSDARAFTDTYDVDVTPAVAMVPSLDTQYGGSDIVAYLATAQAVYPQLLGSRDEEVTGGGPGAPYNTKLSAIEGNPSSTSSPIQNTQAIAGAPEDAFNAGANNGNYFAYLSATPDWNTTVAGLEHVPNFRAAVSASPTSLTIGLQTSESGVTNAYADYDIEPGGQVGGSGTGPFTLSRHQIIANIGGTLDQNTAVQGVAVGDDDTLYMTVNELRGAYIEAVQEQNPNLNNTSSNGTRIKWRYTVGTNSAYAPGALNTGNARFIGAPVVDKDHVYALAESANGVVYVLCFNHDASFSFSAGAITEGSVTLQQTDENGTVQSIEPGQFNIVDAEAGTIDITNFSPSASSNYTIYPNLSASIPIQSSGGAAGAQSSSTSINSSSDGSGLLQWYKLVNVPMGVTTAPPGALREFGGYLYFGYGYTPAAGNTPGTANIESVDAATGTQANSSSISSSTPVTGPMAASGAAVIGVGSDGIVGAAYNGTMVADSSRLIEYAPDGSPMWSLDSTTQQAPVTDSNTGETLPATTNISLSRPSSVTLLNSNDILFADTGNNRCVRVDRGGNVLWELNSFSDPTGLLAPGQPLTLNDPTSVVEWRENTTDSSGNVLTIEHFLVADAGNSRIVEVDDLYTNGQIFKTDPQEYHVLRWVSHTFDKAGRTYRYVYASRYFPSSTGSSGVTAGTFSILAGVSNRQIAPLVMTSATATPYLDNASRDSAGSTVVLLNYAATPLEPALEQYTPPAATGPNQTLGPVSVYRVVKYGEAAATGAYTDPSIGMPSGLITQVYYSDVSGNIEVLPVRNLRYVDAYLPTSQAGVTYGPGENVVIADDDGVFDGIIYHTTTAPGATYSIVAVKQATLNGTALNNKIAFSFTQADYKTLLDASGATYAPKYVFTPTSVQRLDNGDYLITNGATSGDAAPVVDSSSTATNAATIDALNNAQHFGGDVIEISGTNKTQIGTTFGRQKTSPDPTSSGTTDVTAPLSLPAYAVRAQ